MLRLECRADGEMRVSSPYTTPLTGRAVLGAWLSCSYAVPIPEVTGVVGLLFAGVGVHTASVNKVLVALNIVWCGLKYVITCCLALLVVMYLLCP